MFDLVPVLRLRTYQMESTIVQYYASKALAALARNVAALATIRGDYFVQNKEGENRMVLHPSVGEHADFVVQDMLVLAERNGAAQGIVVKASLHHLVPVL